MNLPQAKIRLNAHSRAPDKQPFRFSVVKRVLSQARQARLLAPLRMMLRAPVRIARALARRGKAKTGRVFHGLLHWVFRDLYAVVERHSDLIEECESSLEVLEGRQDHLRFSLERRMSNLESSCAALRADLLIEQRRISDYLGTARRHPVQIPLLDPHQDKIDALFEERFRNSSNESTGRLEAYLALLRQAGVGTQSLPVLDLRCGRGDWLDLLRGNGMHGEGVDRNSVFINQCLQRNLIVHQADVLTYLANLPDSCLGAVTGFHLVENLSVPDLMRLLDEVLRILKPGGLIIFETPNPEAIVVSASRYFAPHYLLSPVVFHFIAELQGFMHVELRHDNDLQLNESSPPPESAPPGQDKWMERAKEHFLAAPTYTLIGWKAPGPTVRGEHRALSRFPVGGI